MYQITIEFDEEDFTNNPIMDISEDLYEILKKYPGYRFSIESDDLIVSIGVKGQIISNKQIIEGNNG